MKNKKIYLCGVLILILCFIGIILGFSWNQIQFKKYCQDKEVCSCANQKLSSLQKKTFVEMANYMKKTGKSDIDASVLGVVSADEMAELGLVMKQCSADVARQKMLKNIFASRAQFPGDYYCMREVLMHRLSNEEVLFLQSPQSRSIEALQDPEVHQMYVETSSKLMKCMNEEVQKQYQKELKDIPVIKKKK